MNDLAFVAELVPAGGAPAINVAGLGSAAGVSGAEFHIDHGLSIQVDHQAWLGDAIVGGGVFAQPELPLRILSPAHDLPLIVQQAVVPTGDPDRGDHDIIEALNLSGGGLTSRIGVVAA